MSCSQYFLMPTLASENFIKIHTNVFVIRYSSLENYSVHKWNITKPICSNYLFNRIQTTSYRVWVHGLVKILDRETEKAFMNQNIVSNYRWILIDGFETGFPDQSCLLLNSHCNDIILKYQQCSKYSWNQMFGLK